MKTNNILHKVLSAVFLLLCGSVMVWGQKQGNRYVTEVILTGTIVDSGDWEADNPAGYATDNNQDTYAEADGYSTRSYPWIIFDLGASHRAMTHFTIMGGEGTQQRPASIKVEASDDEDFTDIVSTEEFTNERAVRNNTHYLGTRITQRYVRITFTNNTNSNSITRIHELWMYGDGDDPYGDNVIQHKPAKWFELRDQLGLEPTVNNIGRFNYDQQWFPKSQYSTQDIQASHTYMDTIYVHKGTTVQLKLPARLGDGSSMVTYQRWHSYRTDGTFELQNPGTSGVVDLLTPSGSGTYYKFQNGYVGRPVGDVLQYVDFYVPTNEQFEEWFPSYVGKEDPDWYVVACDVSGYTDFTQNFESKGSHDLTTGDCAQTFRDSGFYEPTLALRAVFYIVAVDDRDETFRDGKQAQWENGHGRLLTADYQGGTEEGRYLEEYDITFPANHISRETDELVALSKDARGYAIPGATSGDTDEVDIKFGTNTAGLVFQNGNTTTNISGEARVIQFKKSGAADNSSWDVADGSTATILVTKTVNGTIYNIARYNLTFEANTIPLTQTQVSQLGTDAANGQSWNYTYRSPEWMNQNLKLLTELTFDYGPNIAGKYGQTEYFPFPLAWSYSSYAFFDGSDHGDYIGASALNGDHFAEWDYYCITNDYMGYNDMAHNQVRPTEGQGKPLSNYHLYIDASDRPGVLAQLPFEEKLCVGSELYATAWIKSACSNGSDDGAVLFTVFGVTNVNGEQVLTPLYRHASGQISTTTYYTDNLVPGTGSSTNDWYQLYFSFINNDPNASRFESYLLQIENNCASTSGGDYYLDDIKVYIMQPTATVTQKGYTCTTERTLMSIELDWERLTSRLGGEATGTETLSGLEFCFVDEVIYQNTYDQLMAAAGENPTPEQIQVITEQAITAGLVEVGDGETYSGFLQTLYFNLNFEQNTLYTADTINLAKDNVIDNQAHLYRVGSADDPAGRRLIVDFYSVLAPNRPYMMLILLADPSVTVSAEDFARDMHDGCSMQTRFYLNSQTLIKLNGEVIDPSDEFCVGQVFNFSAQVRYVENADIATGDNYVVIDKGVYYDWFFGTGDEFLAANTRFGGVSLQSALLDFRHFYPDATELSATATPPAVETGAGTDPEEFTKDAFNIIQHYLGLPADGNARHSRLVLHRESIDFAMPVGGLKMVVQPIQTLIAPAESGLSDEQWAKICWNYIPVLLKAVDRAPQVFVGFNTTSYPADDFAPALRLGVLQIKESVDTTRPIRVDLRGAKVVTEGADQLGIISTQENMDEIYLIATDDPRYANYFNSTDFNQYSLPIGKITYLFAEPYTHGAAHDDHMLINFYAHAQPNGFKFEPREGYTYTFAANFEEKISQASGAATSTLNTCYGSFNVVMKVVPEYLVWTGMATDNWNNDALWKRADKSQLYKADSDTYMTNAENGSDNGFVPMLFSSVVMPADSRVQLYNAGFSADGGYLQWTGEENRPADVGDMTDHIQYDLMVVDENNQLRVKSYRVNLCNDIHFAPGAQMLHAERLLYNHASMDITVPAKTWTLASSPLRHVYAGDWYTNTTGTQQTDTYFADITFDATKHNRLKPAVYQRSWGSNATILRSAVGTGQVAFHTTTPKWSAAYNDASVPYTAGSAFSVKASGTAGTHLVFRLPKADASYDVATASQLDRTSAGKLLVSGLMDRAVPLAPTFQDKVTAELVPSQDGQYMIVGNPFMAPLKLEAFFQANTHLTGSYWVEDYTGTAAGSYDDAGNWTTTGTGTIAPYGAFFVQKKETTGDNTVIFTADMQQFADGAATTAFTIQATNGTAQARAAVAYSPQATDGYDANEDALLMRDLLGNDARALAVYTVAGDMAASVNRVSDLRLIPIGLFAADQDVTRLTFEGLDYVAQPTLYDAELHTETAITEGFELTIEGASHGRYFLRTRGAGDGTTGVTDVPSAAGDTNAYSVVPGQVVVYSGAGLQSVRVYSAGGMLLAQERMGADVTATTIDGIAAGVAIVRIETAQGTVVRKIIVK